MSRKEDAMAIFDAALFSANPLNLDYDFEDISEKEITLLGSGKAAVRMAQAIMQKIPGSIKGGFIVSNFKENIEGIEVFQSTHPSPSLKSVEAAGIMMRKLRSLGKDDFFIYLLSGGTSALMEKPISPVTIDQMRFLNDMLLKCSADIKEINTVRKHLSLVKGGRLAHLTRARGVVYLISDVVGDDPGSIGSAPFYPDATTCEDAKEILKKYGLWEKAPRSVRSVIGRGDHESVKETTVDISHKIVASNTQALKAAHAKALQLGYDAKIVRDDLNDDVRVLGSYIAKSIKEQKNDKPVCLIFGGESRVNLKGSGKGGRNQELALWVLKLIKDRGDIFFLSAGTDGIDGNSDAAGAIVSAQNFKDDIDSFLSDNDSYHYHKREGTLIVTGESGTNVMDIMIAIKE